MLNPFNKLDEIPDELKAHYVKGADGKYHAEIPTDHPAIKDLALVLNDKEAAVAKVTQLESDLAHAAASSLPRGHVAIPKADAALLDEVKALGTPADLKVKLDEHATLKAQVDKQAREDSLKLVAKELGYTNVDAFVRLPNLPDFDIREKDGKKTVIAKVKDDKGVVTEKPAAEFIESSPEHSPFLSALKKSEGVTIHGTAGDGASGADPFRWARDYGKSYVEQSKPVGDAFAAFQERKSA